MPTLPTGQPELIATFQADSVVSGECSACHEVIVVKKIGVETTIHSIDAIERAFLEHVRREHTGVPQKDKDRRTRRHRHTSRGARY
jgi:hypothetical protein